VNPSPFSASTLLVERQEGHTACKKLVLVYWWWEFDMSFARFIAQVVTNASLSSSNKTGELRVIWKNGR